MDKDRKKEKYIHLYEVVRCASKLSCFAILKLAVRSAHLLAI